MSRLVPTVDHPTTQVFEAKVYSQQRKAPLWEVGILAVWIIVNYVDFPGETLALYLCVAYFMAQLVLDYRNIVPVLFKAWPLMLLPIFGMFSFIWSPYPAAAIRSGFFFLLTPIILVVIVTRIESRQIMRCIMVAGMIAALMTATMWGAIPDGGPYAHKNYLAVHILFCLLLCLATLLDRGEPAWLRLATLPFILICPLIILASGSATSLALMLVGCMAMIAVRFFIVDLGRIKHMRTTLLMAGVILLLSIIMVFLSFPNNDVVASILDALGKDTTFTGRTALWKAGSEVAAEHPIFGVGLEGFWQYDVGTSQTLAENDYKEAGTKLGFHSAFLEVQVHLGYVGLLLFLLIIFWCLFQTFKNWAVDANLNSSVFLVMSAIIMTFSFTEGWLWGTFNAVVTVFYFSAINTFGADKREFLGAARIRISEDGEPES